MGIISDSSKGNFISISDHGTMKISENHSGSILADLSPNDAKYSLKNLLNLDKRRAFIVSDANGSIYIYKNNDQAVPVLEKTLKVSSGSSVRGLAVSVYQNMFVAGAVDGSIQIFDL